MKKIRCPKCGNIQNPKETEEEPKEFSWETTTWTVCKECGELFITENNEIEI